MMIERRPLTCLVSVIAVLAATSAHAHDAPSGWTYPPECCTKEDCKVVAAGRVQVGRSGYVLDGKHLIPKARDSGDEQYHACWSPIASEAAYGPRCFFAPRLTH